jgi:hypothetical protein
MPLTEHEKEFLDAYLSENSMAPFTGPATHALRARGILHGHILWLQTAYGREHPLTFDGTQIYYGQPISDPPAPPWADLETASRRDAQLRQELAVEESSSPN